MVMHFGVVQLLLEVTTFEDRFCASKKTWIGRGGQVSAWGTMHIAHSTASMCFLAHLSTSDMTTQMLVTSFIAK